MDTLLADGEQLPHNKSVILLKEELLSPLNLYNIPESSPLFSSVVASLPRVDATSKNHLKTSLHCVHCMLRLHQSAASSDSPCSSGCAHYTCSCSSTEGTSPSKSSHTLGPASSKLRLIHETSPVLQVSLMAPGKAPLSPKSSVYSACTQQLSCLSTIRYVS